MVIAVTVPVAVSRVSRSWSRSWSRSRTPVTVPVVIRVVPMARLSRSQSRSLSRSRSRSGSRSSSSPQTRRYSASTSATVLSSRYLHAAFQRFAVALVHRGLASQLADGSVTFDHAGQCPAEALHVLIDVGEAPPHVLQMATRDEHGRVELGRLPRAVRGRLRDRIDLAPSPPEPVQARRPAEELMGLAGQRPAPPGRRWQRREPQLARAAAAPPGRQWSAKAARGGTGTGGTGTGGGTTVCSPIRFQKHSAASLVRRSITARRPGTSSGSQSRTSSSKSQSPSQQQPRSWPQRFSRSATRPNARLMHSTPSRSSWHRTRSSSSSSWRCASATSGSAAPRAVL